MKTFFKFLIGLGVLALAVWLTYDSLRIKSEVSYLTEPVKRGNISQTVSAIGEITSAHLVDVGAQASGQIRKMHVKIGQRVQKGDLIAEIDNTNQINSLKTNHARLSSYQAQLESAKISLKTAESKYKRYQPLLKAGAISSEEWENTADNLASAKAKLKEIQSVIKQTQIAIEVSQADLGYTRITAPVDGTVVALVVEEGQTVNANQTAPTIVQIADLDIMLNKMQIAEGDATKVKAGQKLKFTVLSEPDSPLEGVLDSVDPGLTVMSKGGYSRSTDSTDSAVYYYARAIVPNHDGKLAIGMTTQNTIEINGAENVLIVPTLIVKEKDGKKMVKVLANNQQVQERTVEVGLKDTLNTEIKSGLTEGEQVIVSEMGDGEQSGSQKRAKNRPPM